MPKLNQILAIEKSLKTRTYGVVTEIHHRLMKEALVKGHTRVYAKIDDAAEDLPAESTLVQVRVGEGLRDICELLARQWDVTAIKEWANREASADVVLPDGTKLLEGVPVTFLLFLEKQLNDMHAIVLKLPVLDPQFMWTWDANANCYRTDAQLTHRTRKVEEPLVLYPATDKHPAQTQLVTKDVLAGYWNMTHLSGAVPAEERQQMIERVEELQRAVKMAREAANDLMVVDHPVAEKVLAHLFPKISLRGVSTA